MASTSVLRSEFRVERSVNDDVALVVKTAPAGLGELGLFVILVSGLFLTAVLGSFNPQVRAAAGPVLTTLVGALLAGGVALKMFAAWAARKTSGRLTISPRARTMSEEGLKALFPWQQFQLPDDAVVVLDAVEIRRAIVAKDSRRQSDVCVRLWCMPADGRSDEQVTSTIEAHRQAVSATFFRSLADVPMPPGGVLVASAFENPIFRRLGVLLAELGICQAYDATGARAERLADAPRKTAVIGAPQRFSIPTVSIPIKILAVVMGTVVATFIALLSLNPFIFVYIVLLITMALSTRQVLVCDDEGLRLHYSYFFGLWRRGHDSRRWDEVNKIQTEKMSDGVPGVAIRRVDGSDWKIIAPSQRAALALAAKLQAFLT